MEGSPYPGAGPNEEGGTANTDRPSPPVGLKKAMSPPYEPPCIGTITGTYTTRESAGCVDVGGAMLAAGDGGQDWQDVGGAQAMEVMAGSVDAVVTAAVVVPEDWIIGVSSSYDSVGVEGAAGPST